MATSKASKVAVWVILGLLIIALGGFGVTSFGGSVRLVGKVGDTEIPVDAYSRELQQELGALTQQTGRAFTLAQAQVFGVDAAVLSRLVSRAALDNETAELGLSVGDTAVREQVTTLPAFQGLDGEFDREAYTFALRNAGFTVSEFEDQIRRDTARNILEAAIVGGIAADPAYAGSIYDWARERRDITWARLGAADLEAPLPEPSEADLDAFHSENEARFTLPETRVVTYAWITPDMLLDRIDADDADLQELYEQRQAEYVRPERRLVERLVFASEDEAASAKAALDAGETTFDALVAERDLTLDDVDLGEVAEEQLDAAGADVFALAEPGVAGPLPSSLGPALYRVNAILAATETTFEEARDALAAEFASDRARRSIDEMTLDIDDLLAAGATLEELAADTDMELGTIDYRQGIEDGIAANLEFRDAALVVREGDFPELLEFEEGGIFALRLDEIRPPELQPLDEVRAEVIAAWEEAETTRRLTERAQAAQQAIESGAEMAGQDLPLRVERGLTRDGFLDDAPPQMLENVFQMREGDVRVFAARDGAALVRLDAVIPPDRDDPEGALLLQNFSDAAGQELAGDALEMFTRAVQATAGIEIYQPALNAIHAHFP